MRKSTLKFNTRSRFGVMAVVLSLGSLAADAQTFIHEGVVYKAAGNKLTAQRATVKPENGDAPGTYAGDIKIPSEISYNGKDYEVTSIAGVFKDMPGLTSIEIADGVTTISRGCFQNDSALVSVKLPADLVTVNGDLFSGCVSLEEITFPGMTKEIASNQLRGCLGLKKIVFEEGETALEVSSSIFGPDGVNSLPNLTEVVLNRQIGEKYTALDDKPFRGSKYLTTVTVGGSTKSIPTSYFESTTALKNVTIAETVTSLGTNVFAGSGIEEITLPASITVIPSSTFSGCKSLSSITIPDGITSIGTQAFINCSELSSIVLPESVANIESSAFRDCSKLNKVYCYAKVAPECTDDPGFNYDTAVLYVSESSLDSYRSAKYWSNFATIIDFNSTPTGIEDIRVDSTDGAVTVYDLQGRKLKSITKPGFYIVNGEKVYVK